MVFWGEAAMKPLINSRIPSADKSARFLTVCLLWTFSYILQPAAGSVGESAAWQPIEPRSPERRSHYG
jgi:hypothetical protein